MPITVRCHACDGRALCPDATAGKRIKCPRCGVELHVPRPPVISEPTSPKGSAPHWAAAPPPVRAAAPAESEGAADWSASPPPVRPAPPVASATPAEPLQQEPDSSRWDLDDAPARYEPPEPWYYRFLEKYTLAIMWAWIILLTLPFLLFTALTILAAVGTAGVGSAAAGTSMRPDAPSGSAAAAGLGAAAGGFGLFLWWFGALLSYVAAVLFVVFIAAHTLLAVDAARNVRAIRLKSP